VRIARFLVRRVLAAVPVVLAVVTLTFAIIHLVPGDPVQVIMGMDADPQRIGEAREALGLDRPLPVQFFDYLGGVLTGDLGTSFFTRQPVLELVLQRTPQTLQLAMAGIGMALMISTPLGIVAAVRTQRRGRRTGDQTAFTMWTSFLVATPDFLAGTLLVYLFAVRWRWFPVAGSEGLSSIVLPAFALGLSLAGIQARVVRASVLDSIDSPFVRTLRSAGINERRILFRHVLRNASIPVLTLLSVEFGRLLAGALIIENIFARPGLGTLIVDSIARRDLPAIQGEILVVAVIILLVNMAMDVQAAVLDPRVEMH
jgi:ABC-type dipeptide/oligopeptide/nickel transport system permease component